MLPVVVNSLPANAVYHFIGIGGYGMSGLARILAEAGLAVQGSDLRETVRSEQLRTLGIQVFYGHAETHLGTADIVVYSTDIPDNNVEWQAARARGLICWHRSQLLAQLINANQGIAVTGTHGKTTTTAMIGSVLIDGGYDPTISVGGELDKWAGTGRLGRSAWVVAEACESDGTFLHYRPQRAIVTNLEPEHLEHYGDSFDQLKSAMASFVGQMPADGLLLVCAEDAAVLALVAHATSRVLTFGIQPDADVSAQQLQIGKDGWQFTVVWQGKILGVVQLQVPGRHNVMNALAAIAVSLDIGIPFAKIAASLGQFVGSKRRFQVLWHDPELTIVDDYAHHPTEISATLQAAQERSAQRVVAVFQPHRYARTERLFEQFVNCFDQSDILLITDIYAPAGEPRRFGVSGQALADRVRARVAGPVHFVPTKEDAHKLLLAIIRPGDLVITMGAGDISELGHRLAERCRQRS